MQTDTHEFDTALIDDNRSNMVVVSFGDGNTTLTDPRDGGTNGGLVNETYYKQVLRLLLEV